jgi:Glycogen recognition site of AMP-activated protein kinase
MDMSHVRRKGKQPYETVREQLEELGDRVIARHGDDAAPARQGYRRFLGTLDGLAGRLLDDDEIAQRGQDLLRENEADGTTGPDEAAGSEDSSGGAEAGGADGPAGADGAEEAAVADGAEAPQGAATDETASESVWEQASGEVDRAGEAEVGEAWAAGNARLADEAGQTQAATSTPTVEVVFSLPAETTAERVALCGDFNDWAPESISLTRGADRSWQVTVALVPGSYRYKYLLDGVTWENGPDADRYEENAYGTLDSVVEVSPRL